MERAKERTGYVASPEVDSGGVATTKVLPETEQAPLILQLRPVIEITDEQLFDLCQINENLWIELSIVQAEMQEYLDNGAQLGWPIDPPSRQVYVYRPNRPVERLGNPTTISGDPARPGFVLDLHMIWEPGF